MQYQQWIDDCNLLCDWLARQMSIVRNSIESSNGFAYLQRGNSSPISGGEARYAIASFISKLDYPEYNEALKESDDVYAAACVSIEVIKQADRLNMIKAEFREFHEKLRASFSSGKEGTEAMRLVLKRCGYPRLNLENADRLLPTVVAPATKLSWHYNQSPPSRRRTLADAVLALRKLQDVLGEPTHDAIEQDISNLESGQYPMNLPVAEVLRRNPVQSLRLAYSYLDTEGTRQRELSYGRNPALVLDRSGPLVCVPPKEITGNGVADGRGRPKIISDRSVASFLQGWYHDNNPATKQRVPTKGTQNVNAKTSVPGVWFAMSRHGKPVFAFRDLCGQRTTRSIQRYGLRQAWEYAIHNMQSHPPADVRNALAASPPLEADVQRFVSAKNTAMP